VFRPVRLLTLALVAAIATTGATCQRRDTPTVVTTPGTHTVTEKLVYVRIDDALTQPCTVVRGPLREVVSVARQRRACIEDLNARMAEIAAIEGTPVRDRPQP